MASPRESLRIVVEELERLQPNGILDVLQFDHDVLPTYRTAESGEERYFSIRALKELRKVARWLYENDPSLASMLREEKFAEVVLQAATDCHVAGQFDPAKDDEKDEALRKLRERSRANIDALTRTFTHHLPAWTIGIEASGPFAIGPVTFLTREQWIDAVDFPESIRMAWTPDWKASLRNRLLADKRDPPRGLDLSHDVHRAIHECPSILQITVNGNELELSRQRARFACRTALDSLALLMNRGDLHRQFVLFDERLEPIRQSRLISTDGRLWPPGGSFHPRGWDMDPAMVSDIVANGRKLLHASGRAIEAVLDPSSHPAPKLAQRWATALAWFADGCREKHDAVALAKIASSMDMLSCGGKYNGILDFIAHLTKTPTDRIIVESPPLTMAQVVKLVYDSGRSQILHGTQVDSVKDFSAERRYATTLARIALRECVQRWVKYTGPNHAKAFRSISQVNLMQEERDNEEDDGSENPQAPISTHL